MTCAPGSESCQLARAWQLSKTSSHRPWRSGDRWWFIRIGLIAGCPEKRMRKGPFRTISERPCFCIQNPYTHKAIYPTQCYRCYLTQVGDVRVLILKLLVIPGFLLLISL